MKQNIKKVDLLQVARIDHNWGRVEAVEDEVVGYLSFLQEGDRTYTFGLDITSKESCLNLSIVASLPVVTFNKRCRRNAILPVRVISVRNNEDTECKGDRNIEVAATKIMRRVLASLNDKFFEGIDENPFDEPISELAAFVGGEFYPIFN